jgi:hypothetical protein
VRSPLSRGWGEVSDLLMAFVIACMAVCLALYVVAFTW